jgi:hypothetical protein
LEQQKCGPVTSEPVPRWISATVPFTKRGKIGSDPTSQFQPPILVHLQKPYCRSANWSQANDLAVLVKKMFVPIVQARMKRTGELVGSRVEASQIGPFLEVALVTGQRKVLRNVTASMLSGDDMFDVKGQRLLLLPQAAILAPARGTLPDKLTKPWLHQMAPASTSTRRALAWRTPINVLAWT